MTTYSFGIPGFAIWSFHIIFGFFLAYIGYMLLNKKDISQPLSITLIIVGTLAIAYHAHLVYYYNYSDSQDSSRRQILPIN